MSRDSEVENEIEVSFEYKDEDHAATFTRITKFCREEYGADADGNRGEMRTEVDDDHWKEKHALIGGKKLLECESGLHEEARAAIDSYMADSKNDPEPPSSDDRGGEPEDIEDR